MRRLLTLVALCLSFMAQAGHGTLKITFSDGQTLTWGNSNTTEYVIIKSQTSWNPPAFIRKPNFDEYLVYDNSYYQDNHKKAVNDYTALQNCIAASYYPYKVKELVIKTCKGMLGYEVGVFFWKNDIADIKN